MRILLHTVFWIGVVAYVFDCVLMALYCKAGFLGYADEWSSERAEKLHYVIVPASLAVMLITAFVILLIY